MKCPRCGSEMTLDSHRKIELFMCYECGYIEGRRNEDGKVAPQSNFERLRKMNLNEAVPFLARGLGLDEQKLADWLEEIK